MIHTLLLAIQKRLQAGLRNTFPQSDRIALKTTHQPPSSIPTIQLAAGKFDLDHRSREHNFTQTTDRSVTVLREFQQLFSIEIYDRTPALLEQWSTLVTAIVLTNRDDLIHDFNHSQTSEIPNPEYRATDYTALLYLSDFRFLGGMPSAGETNLGLQLSFEAIGQLTLTKTETEPLAIIETVPISVQVEGTPGTDG